MCPRRILTTPPNSHFFFQWPINNTNPFPPTIIRFLSLHFCLVYAFRPVLRFYINATGPGFTQGSVSVIEAIKPSAPIWKGVSLIMSNHFNYNSKLLVMPRHNVGRHLVFRASVIKWNDLTYRIHFTAKQGKDKDVDAITPFSLSPAYRIPEPKIFSAQNCWH